MNPIATLDDLAAEIAKVTGATAPEVHKTLAKMGPDDAASAAKAFGLDYAPNGAKSRGRPTSKLLDICREAYPNVSARSIARMGNALRLLHEAGLDGEQAVEIEALYRRRNGSFNAAAFERHARQVWHDRLIRRYVEGKP